MYLHNNFLSDICLLTLFISTNVSFFKDFLHYGNKGLPFKVCHRVFTIVNNLYLLVTFKVKDNTYAKLEK